MPTCCACLEEKTRVVLCTSCGEHGCESCQTIYAVAACMACQVAFTEEYLIRSGHQKLVKTVLRPAQETMFWNREKEFLPATQKLVDWETAVMELYKQVRFGYKVTFPPKPAELIMSQANSVFPCPSAECRGFVVPSEKRCGACKRTVCTLCRSLVPGTSHTCDPSILETLAALQKDSKACPKCFASIFRVSGCNHMFCTNCRTHFDWATGQILSKSTNHHYDQTTPFSKNVPVQEGATAAVHQRCESFPSLSRPQRDDLFPAEVIRLIFQEPKIVEAYAASNLQMHKLREAHDQALIRVRMQFLKGVSEAQCKKKVWLLEQNLQLRTTEAELVRDFLLQIDSLQKKLRASAITSSESLLQLHSRVNFFNKLLQDAGSKINFKIHEGPLLNM